MCPDLVHLREMPFARKDTYVYLREKWHARKRRNYYRVVLYNLLLSRNIYMAGHYFAATNTQMFGQPSYQKKPLIPVYAKSQIIIIY